MKKKGFHPEPLPVIGDDASEGSEEEEDWDKGLEEEEEDAEKGK